MILSIHQPCYFPWLGLLDKIRKSDVFMVMDEVQLSDSAYQHRNLFLTPQGGSKYLTIPFVRKGYLEKPFRELEIADQGWQKKHAEFLWNSYRDHPFYPEIMDRVRFVFSKEFRFLLDPIVDSLRATLEMFEIRTRVIFQSQLSYDRSLRKKDLVLELIRASGADIYLSGTGARDYMDASDFPAGCELRYNDFVHPVYPQKNTKEFVPGLASLDALFNVGLKGARLL